MNARTAALGVFGSWRPDDRSPLYKDAAECARRAVSFGFTIVTGGYSGIMDAASKGASESGGKAIGFLCPELSAHLNSSPGLSTEIMCHDYVERVARTVQACDAFLFFPGRLGTATELVLAVELVAKGIKPFPIMLWGTYWNAWLEQLILTTTNESANGEDIRSALWQQVNSTDELMVALADIRDYGGQC